MDINENYLKRFQKSTRGPKSERAELIGLITRLTNESRKLANYPPWSERTVAVKLSFLKLIPLKDHFFACYKNEVFDGKRFWGAIKPKKKS